MLVSKLAEIAGDKCPDRVQRLMCRNNWELEGVLDEHIRFCDEHFGHYDGTFIVDKTGFLKSGKSSVGVQRQYTGTAGKITNCQVGVFLGYTSEHGNALLDRRLYMPDSWISDRKRCDRVKVPTDLPFLPSPSWLWRCFGMQFLIFNVLAVGLSAMKFMSWIHVSEKDWLILIFALFLLLNAI